MSIEYTAQQLLAPGLVYEHRFVQGKPQKIVTYGVCSAIVKKDNTIVEGNIERVTQAAVRLTRGEQESSEWIVVGPTEAAIEAAVERYGLWEPEEVRKAKQAAAKAAAKKAKSDDEGATAK